MIIVKCTCKHDFQDKQYGKNMRVANPAIKCNKCTVCGKEHKK